jgi:hypothetical protein
MAGYMLPCTGPHGTCLLLPLPSVSRTQAYRTRPGMMKMNKFTGHANHGGVPSKCHVKQVSTIKAWTHDSSYFWLHYLYMHTLSL